MRTRSTLVRVLRVLRVGTPRGVPEAKWFTVKGSTRDLLREAWCKGIGTAQQVAIAPGFGIRIAVE